MQSEEIRAHLRKQPFRPIRVHVSDGSAYDVPHPDFMFVTRTEIVIGLEPSRGDIPERSVYIDPSHITRITFIDGEGKRKRPGRLPKRQK